jgi:hypothetical protein
MFIRKRAMHHNNKQFWKSRVMTIKRLGLQLS